MNRCFIYITALTFFSSYCFGANFIVSDADVDGANGLRAAINNVNAMAAGSGAQTITISLPGGSSFTWQMSSTNLPPIMLNSGVSLSILGPVGGITLDGTNGTSNTPPFRGLMVESGTVSVSQMNFQNLLAKGGNGGGGFAAGGGGLGAGAGFYIRSGSAVTIDTAQFISNAAQGGTGGNAGGSGSGGGGGGGGMGGSGGSSGASNTGSGGGGGGLFGAGGNGVGSGGGAGGGGSFFAGGSGGGSGQPFNSGGGGGGRTSAGGNATGAGGAGGGPSGGAGAPANSSQGGGNGDATLGGGGGGGAASGGKGGNGGPNGGGGGGGGSGGASSGGGGTGGINGGGGSAGGNNSTTQAAAGIGGYGGGGAGASLYGGSITFPGASTGGFGGGGGGATISNSAHLSNGAPGGFGGGGGGGAGGGSTGGASAKFGGSGGSGAGSMNFSAGGGGGGAALGGTFFIENNATLTINDNVSLSQALTPLTAGTGGTGAGIGTAGASGSIFGQDIFLNAGGSFHYNSPVGSTLTVINLDDGGDAAVAMRGLFLDATNTGTLVLTGTGSSKTNYRGNVTIGGGTLQIQGDPTNFTSTISDNASLSFLNSPTSTFSGSINGTGTVSLSTSNVLTIAAANTYSGNTIITSGTWRGNSSNVFSPNSIHNVTGTLDVNSTSQTIGGLIGVGTVPLGTGSLTINTNSSVTFSGSITGTTAAGSNALVIGGTSIQTLSANTNNYTGITAVTSGTLQAGVNSAFSSTSVFNITGTLDLNNTTETILGLTGSGAVTLGTGTLTINNSSPATFSGAITGTTAAGSNALVINGGSTETLSGSSNTYTGITNVASGTLQAGANNAFSPNSTHNVAGTLDLNNTTQTILGLTGAGGVTLGTGGLTINNTAPAVFSGSITGTTAAGSNALVIGGTSIQTLSANTNNYTGITAVTSGTLRAGVNSAFSSTSVFNITGTLDLNNTTETILGLTGSGAVTLGTGTLTINNSSPATFSGAITGSTAAGSNAVVIGGTSIQTLSGNANNYTGITAIASGTLQAGANDAFSPNSSHNVTGTLDLNNTTQALLNLTGSGAVTLGTGTLTINNSAPATFSGSITGTTLAATNALVINGGSIETLSGSSNTYTGITDVASGTLRAGANNAFSPNSTHNVTGTLDLNNNTEAILGLTGTGAVLLGTGSLTINTISPVTFAGSITGTTAAGSNALAIDGTSIQTLSANTNNYTGITAVTSGTLRAGVNSAFSSTSVFNITGTLDLNNTTETILGLTGSGTVTLGTGTLTINNSSPATFSGAITGTTAAGSNALVINGGSTETLSGSSNTYTGMTDVVSGTLRAGANDAFSPNSTHNVTGTLDLNNTTQTILGLTGAGGVALGTGGLTINNTAPAVFSGSITGTTAAGSNALVIGGTSIQTLSANTNNYTGITAVTSGTLRAGVNSAFSSTSVFNITGTLDLNNTTETILGLTGAGAVTLGTGTLTINNSSPATFSGAITGSTAAGSNALVINGSSIETLSGNSNTYTGITDIASGTLQAGANDAFSPNSIHNVTGTLDLNNTTQTILGLTGAGAVVLGTGGLTINNTAPAVFSGSITGTTSATSNALVIAGGSIQTLSGNTNNYTGITAVTSGTLRASINNAFSTNSSYNVTDTLDLNNTNQTILGITGNGSISLGSGQITVNGGASNFAFSGAISGTGGSLIKSGAGTQSLSGNNTYNGGTTINDGTLSLSGTGSLLSTGAVSLSSGTSIFDVASITSTTTIGDLSGVVNSSVALGSKTLILGTTTPSVTFSGTIGGNGGALTKQGSGSWILTNANTYTGETTIAAGTLSLSGSGSLAPTGSISIASSTSIFDISNVTSGTTVGNVSGVANSSITLGSKQLTVGISSPSVTFAGNISGMGGEIVKEGSGAWILTGINNYTGPTTVAAGILIINGSVTSSISINSGATLQGTGTVGSIIIDGGAILSPGNSIGVLHSGPVTFNSGSIFQVEIDPSNASLLQVTGSAALAGNVKVIQDMGNYPEQQQYKILEATNITGAFDPTVLGALPGFNFSLIQINNAIFLQYGNFFPVLPTSGLSGNSAKIANYLNQNASFSTISLFNNLTGNTLDKALNSVSPARNAFGLYVAEQTSFSLSSLVSSHLDHFRFSETAVSQDKNITFLLKTSESLTGLTVNASNDIDENFMNATADTSNTVTVPLPNVEKRQNKWCTWISGFAEFAHQSASSQNPSFDYFSDGILTGLDYRGENKALLGGGLGYAHTHFSANAHAGHGNINYYFASVYANRYIHHFYLSPAIWGIFNEIHNTRNISFPGFSEKAKADFFAWQLVPHLEVGYDWVFKRAHMALFSAVDWAISWQRAYKEHGASPFNAKEKARTTSIVRSETGFKFSEEWQRNWGAFFLHERIGYVFEKPFGNNSVNTAFVGTPGSFTVTAVNKNLNLVAIGLDLVTAVGKIHPVLIRVGYEGEFGSNYQSNELMLTISKEF